MNHQELRRAIQEIANMNMGNRGQVAARLRALANQIERGEAARISHTRADLPPVRGAAWHRAHNDIQQGVSVVEIARRHRASVREVVEWLNAPGVTARRRPRRNGTTEL